MKTLINEVKEVISREGLDKKDRRRHIVHARFYLMNLLRKHEVKLKSIGELFNMHHATVVHGINQYQDLKQMKDRLLDEDTRHLQAIFEGRYKEPVFSVYYDVCNAVTRHDFKVIQSRMEQGIYSDVNYK